MLVSMQIFLDHATKQVSMYSNGWNIYLLIYSNALWCDYYLIIVFMYNLLQNGRTAGGKTDSWTGALLSKRYGFGQSVPHG